MGNRFSYDEYKEIISLIQEYLPEVIFDGSYELENGKIIRRIYVNHLEKFNIYNKNTWRSCYEFYIKLMPKFERFFYEYENVINCI